jgi:Fic family protein
MLLQFGYEFTSVVSHEKLIEQSKADYYLALNKTQQTRKTDGEDISHWLLFFLRIVHQQAEAALDILQRKDQEFLLSGNQQAILNWARTREEQTFTRKDAIASFDIPPRTIEEAVKRLLELKLIERLGAGRATRYRYLRYTNLK